MTERPWTPGPWKIPEDSPRLVRIRIAPGRYASAYAGTVANAHLIASAPKLYELLTEIREWMDVEMGEWDAEFIIKIDALLLKAQGKEIPSGE